MFRDLPPTSQNPDSPGERERIEAMGGFVSDPEEAGASSRVCRDVDFRDLNFRNIYLFIEGS